MTILQMIGLLGRVISSSQSLDLNTGQHKHRINAYTYQTSMPCVEFEPTIAVSKRAKTVHCLDRSATVTGHMIHSFPEIPSENIPVEYGHVAPLFGLTGPTKEFLSPSVPCHGYICTSESEEQFLVLWNFGFL
jgi:hypothetical protein